jgi:hypothetical protein
MSELHMQGWPDYPVRTTGHIWGGSVIVPGPRDYTRRTIMALAHLSGGLCYWPGCPEPVLREVGGDFHLIVEIAHIRGAYAGSARFESSMTDDQRRYLPNLLLLCNPHHDIVDAQDKEKLYTPDLLHRWKDQRESDPRQALKRLRDVSPSDLRRIVSEGLEEHDSKVLRALDRLEDGDREAAALMRSLIDELTEAYTRQRESLNIDAIESLMMTTNKLGRLQEAMESFGFAVDRLTRNPRFNDY